MGGQGWNALGGVGVSWEGNGARRDMMMTSISVCTNLRVPTKYLTDTNEESAEMMRQTDASKQARQTDMKK
jgi:hypothetical protein